MGWCRSPTDYLRSGLIDQDRQDDYGTYNDKLPERIDGDDDKAVLDNRNDECADERANNCPLAAKERRTANDHCRDGIEQQGITSIGRAVRET